MNVYANLLILVGVALALSGCSDSDKGGDKGSDGAVKHTVAFQKIGSGACRGADNDDDLSPQCKKADAATCKKMCSDDPKCVGYETAETRHGKSSCTAEEKCEIHTKAATKVDTDHKTHECYRKVEITEFPKGGACRTADDKEGDFECVEGDKAACKAACLGRGDCHAYEFGGKCNKDDEKQKCEIHKIAITKTDRSDDHSNHQCFAVDAAQEVEVTFQKVGDGACRGADGKDDLTHECQRVVGGVSGCKKACSENAKCVGYETAETKYDEGPCTGGGFCEIYTKAATQVDTEQKTHKCYRKVEITTFPKGGACRTADDKEGEFDCVKGDKAECKAACLGRNDCLAYEFGGKCDKDDEKQKCEIHKTAITKTDRSDDHNNHQCFVVDAAREAVSKILLSV